MMQDRKDDTSVNEWDRTLREGRNEFWIDVEGIDFHVVYDKATASTAPPASTTQLDTTTDTPDIPKTRVELVDDEPSHGDVVGTEAHEIRRGDAVPDEVEVIPESTSSIGESPIPKTRVELVDDEPSHGDVPGTEAHDMRKGDAAPDEVEVIHESQSLGGSAPDRPFVLLSHALMADLRMWDSTVRALNNAGYDCIRYDHIGHGGRNGTGRKKTEWRGRSWHFDDFTRHMKLIIEKVRPGEEPVSEVGCSMGGVLAVRYAMLYLPQEQGNGKLKVVCIGAPGMKSLEASKGLWEERKRVIREDGVGRLARMTSERWFPEPVGEGVRERAEGMCAGCDMEGYERCTEGMVNYDYESGEELEGLRSKRVDVLVVRGENDEAVGPKSILEGLAERVGGKFVEMKQVGHLPPMHDEKGFEKVLLEFLRE